LVIVSHLGMDGAWHIDTRPSYRTRCLLVFEEHTVVGNSLAKLEMFPPEEARQYLAFLGPDLLDEAWNDQAKADQLLAQSIQNLRKALDQPIATALLDQRLVSGIGNIYRCEALLLARINPHRLVSELSDQQLAGLVLLARDLMVINVPPRAPERARRRTVDVRPDEQAPFGVRVATQIEQARAQTDRRRARNDPNYWVYGRERQGCLRCGGPVRLEKLGSSADKERDLYWCPNCQRR
jgi:endonuclease-8